MDGISCLNIGFGCSRPPLRQTEGSRVGVVSGDGGGVPVSAHSPLPREAVQAVGPRRSLLTLLVATVALVTSPLVWVAGAAAESASLPHETPEAPAPSPVWDPSGASTPEPFWWGAERNLANGGGYPSSDPTRTAAPTLSTTPSHSASPTPSPVARLQRPMAAYSFSRSMRDVTPNLYDGVIYGNMEYPVDRFGRASEVIRFNGETFANLPYSFALHGDWSIGVWFTTEDVARHTQQLVNTIPHTGMGLVFNYLGTPGITFAVGNCAGQWISPFYVSAQGVFSRNTWYHTMFTKKADVYTLYINGDLGKQVTIPGTPTCYPQLRLGDIQIGGYPSFFLGGMDDFTHYPFALTQSEVRAQQLLNWNPTSFAALPTPAAPSVCPSVSGTPTPPPSPSRLPEASTVPPFPWEANLAELNEGLVEYWPLQGTPHGVFGSGGDGVSVVGTLRVEPDGLIGPALRFDGNTFLRSGAIDFPTSSRTIVVAFHPTRGDIEWPLFSYGGGVCGTSFMANYNAVVFGVQAHSFGFYAHCTGNEIGYDVPVPAWTMLNRWNIFVGTMGSGGSKGYLNGKLLFESPRAFFNTNVYSTLNVQNGKRFCIGSYVTPDGEDCYHSHFQGMLSHVMLWDRELSADAVKTVSCWFKHQAPDKLQIEGCPDQPVSFIEGALFQTPDSGLDTLPHLSRLYEFNGNSLDSGPFGHPLTALGPVEYGANGVHITGQSLLRASTADLGGSARTVFLGIQATSLPSDKAVMLFGINGINTPSTCGEGYSMSYNYLTKEALVTGSACDPKRLDTPSYPRSYFNALRHIAVSTTTMGTTCIYVDGETAACRTRFPLSLSPKANTYLTLGWLAKSDGALYTAETGLVPLEATFRYFGVLDAPLTQSQARALFRQVVAPSPSVTPPAASASASACPPAPSQSECPAPPTCAPLPTHSMTPSPVVFPTCPPQETEFVVVERFVNRTVEVCTTPSPIPVEAGEVGVPVWGVAIVGMAPAALLGCCVYMVMQKRLQDVSAQNVMQRSGSSAGEPGLTSWSGRNNGSLDASEIQPQLPSYPGVSRVMVAPPPVPRPGVGSYPLENDHYPYPAPAVPAMGQVQNEGGVPL